MLAELWAIIKGWLFSSRQNDGMVAPVLNSWDDLVGQLREWNNDLRREIDRAHKEIAALSAELEKTRLACKGLAKQLESSQEDRQNLHRELQQVLSRVAEQQKELDECKTDRAELHQRLAKVENGK